MADAILSAEEAWSAALEGVVVPAGSREAAVHDVNDAIRPETLQLSAAETDVLVAWVTGLQDAMLASDSSTDILALTQRPSPPEGTSYARWVTLCRRVLIRIASEPSSTAEQVIEDIRQVLARLATQRAAAAAESE